MTRVLVAGAAGFIGRHVVDYVVEETDWQVVTVARQKTVDGTPGPGIASAADHGDRVVRVYCDLAHTDPRSLAKVVGDGVEYVVNLAADADAARSLHNPAYTVENNARSMLTLLEWACTQPRLQRFIHVSSAEVFGVGVYPFAETAPVRPLSPYAASKAAQDAVAYAYRKAYGLPVLVSHTANVFGEGQPAGRFLPTIVRRALAGEALEVAEGWRRFIHARDCAAAWVWMLEHAPQDWSHCNVAGERETDHVQFVQAVLMAMKGRLPEKLTLVVKEDLRFGQHGDVVLDGSRLKEAGWRHPVGLDAGVERTVAALLGQMP